MVPPASYGIPRVPQYSGPCSLSRPFAYMTFTFSGAPSHALLLKLNSLIAVLNPEGIATSGLASFHFARRYFENRFCFHFLRLLRCFSSAGLPAYCYLIHSMLTGFLLPAGFPHSDIPGSIDICSSPRLFAACHVLHRLLMPRHSPCALSSLTNYV